MERHYEQQLGVCSLFSRTAVVVLPFVDQDANNRISQLEDKLSSQDYQMQQNNEEKKTLQLRIDQMLEDHRFDKERLYNDLTSIRKRADEMQTLITEKDAQSMNLISAREQAETSIDPLKTEVRSCYAHRLFLFARLKQFVVTDYETE